MGALSRLRAWISGLFGGDADAEIDEEPDDEGTEPDEGTADEPEPGLDPAAVTEARTDTTDDAVEALQEIRRSSAGDEPNADAVASDGEVTNDNPPTNGTPPTNDEPAGGAYR